MGQNNANPPMARSYLETSTRVCLAFLQSGPLVKIKAKQAADVTPVERRKTGFHELESASGIRRFGQTVRIISLSNELFVKV
ncbi:hypothetical protein WN51_06244 [Melipona quadrifasciata]|uniref:Uncharacterized protein n=1 Tax=Melipona quadrifasciata TaxID=166423 RepID=A0A0M8ZS52_9HYME|nr:hypothetical protein WN51_06244 [Melipona quadrifasciata]